MSTSPVAEFAYEIAPGVEPEGEWLRAQLADVDEALRNTRRRAVRRQLRKVRARVVQRQRALERG